MAFNGKEVALWWVVFVQIQTVKKRNYVSTSAKKKKMAMMLIMWYSCCLSRDYNIQSGISPCLKKQIWIHSLHIWAAFLQLTSPNMRKECSHGFDDACYLIAWRIRWPIEQYWVVLDCCKVSGVPMSASATPKSVLIGKYRQHETDLLSKGHLWKGESRTFSTKQTCRDEPNMSRRG